MSDSFSPPPPASETELLASARRLAGRSLDALAAERGVVVPPDQRHAKGWVGRFLERCLGATAGSRAAPDFEAIGVEMKTLPFDARGVPTESTFVAHLDLAKASLADWEASHVRHKLARVLWVPIEAEPSIPLGARRVGTALLWSPSPAQDAALRCDFLEIVELIEAGFLERVTGHTGQWLQLRPKGANAAELRHALDADGGPVRAPPRAFYLRPAFTAAILREHFLLRSRA